ncbi:TonB family protein [Spirosoma arcticum]
MKIKSLFFVLILHVPAFAQETVYQSFDVDSIAQPRGGIAYLNTFLQVNLRKPVAIESKGIGGRAVVSGIVEPDGHVTDAKAITGKSPELDREAVRVFRLFNAWQPAQKDGKAVRQQVNVPVVFGPNPPFSYVDGTQIDYFDADRKFVAEGSEQVRYKQVSPIDTNGLPNGDRIIYKAKGTSWKEDYRLPLVRSKSEERSPRDKPVYLIGYRNEDKLWRGNVFGVDDTGALVSLTYYDNGRSTSLSQTYHANGSVAQRTELVDGNKASTSWYPNGQIKQVWTANDPKPMSVNNPDQVIAFWDSTGQSLVRDGNGRAIYTEMRKSHSDTTQHTLYIEQGLYANGFKQGTWTGHYADGSYFYEEQYDKGVCQGGKARTAGNDTVRYTTQMEQPEFKGGMQGLGQFLAQNLRYPADAQRARVQGRVFLSFVVCTDGTLCDYEVIKGLDSSINQEALRVVKAMNGRWKPGTRRGQKVRVKYTMPINFTLQ